MVAMRETVAPMPTFSVAGRATISLLLPDVEEPDPFISFSLGPRDRSRLNPRKIQFWKSSTSVYSVGTKTRARMVELIIPPKMTQPIGDWTSAPSSIFSMTGICAKIRADDVMRMGRSRRGPASIRASNLPMPCSRRRVLV